MSFFAYSKAILDDIETLVLSKSPKNEKNTSLFILQDQFDKPILSIGKNAPLLN
jgi:hypothetical protein